MLTPVVGTTVGERERHIGGSGSKKHLGPPSLVLHDHARAVSTSPLFYTTVIFKISSVTLVAPRSRDTHSLPAFLVLGEALILFFQINICDAYKDIFGKIIMGTRLFSALRSAAKQNNFQELYSIMTFVETSI